MEIFITRDGQQFGPYTLDDVNAYLASGELSGDDLGWHDGAADWLPLRTMEGVVAPRSSAPPPPPSMAANQPAQELALYSLATIGRFSLLAGPAWGAFLVRSNWLAMGRSKEAKDSLMGFWCLLLVPILLGFVFASVKSPNGTKPSPGGLFFLIWLCWYFFNYKPQAKFVKETYGDSYPRRSAAIPVIIGLILLALQLLALF